MLAIVSSKEFLWPASLWEVSENQSRSKEPFSVQDKKEIRIKSNLSIVKLLKSLKGLEEICTVESRLNEPLKLQNEMIPSLIRHLITQNSNPAQNPLDLAR